MKNTILRILIGAILLSLVSGIVVALSGLMLGWKTSAQFSDGLFWAAGIMILFGFVSFRGYSRGALGRAPVYLDPAEYSRLRVADAFRGKSLIALLGITGLLLFGMSILASVVGNPF